MDRPINLLPSISLSLDWCPALVRKTFLSVFLQVLRVDVRMGRCSGHPVSARERFVVRVSIPSQQPLNSVDLAVSAASYLEGHVIWIK